MRPFWNALIKGFYLVVLWGFKYEVEKMAWHPYFNTDITEKVGKASKGIGVINSYLEVFQEMAY